MHSCAHAVARVAHGVSHHFDVRILPPLRLYLATAEIELGILAIPTSMGSERLPETLTLCPQPPQPRTQVGERLRAPVAHIGTSRLPLPLTIEGECLRQAILLLAVPETGLTVEQVLDEICARLPDVSARHRSATAHPGGTLPRGVAMPSTLPLDYLPKLLLEKACSRGAQGWR